MSHKDMIRQMGGEDLFSVYTLLFVWYTGNERGGKIQAVKQTNSVQEIISHRKDGLISGSRHFETIRD